MAVFIRFGHARVFSLISPAFLDSLAPGSPRWNHHFPFRIGASPSGKAAVFGTAIRWFESSRPSHLIIPFRAIIIDKNPLRGTLKIFVLVGAKGPDKNHEAEESEKQGDRHKIKKNAHFLNLKRKQLAMTTREEPDIAKAATNGVTMPQTAIGIAIKL